MQLFWQKGFAASSVDQLVHATGVQRFSMYGTFGDKSGLLRAALRCYDERVVGRLLAGMEHGSGGIETIVDYFQSLAAYHRSPAGRRGCLMKSGSIQPWR